MPKVCCSTSVDRAGRTTSFAYDAVGRLTQTTYPDGKFETSVYDAVGQVIDFNRYAGPPNTLRIRRKWIPDEHLRCEGKREYVHLRRRRQSARRYRSEESNDPSGQYDNNRRRTKTIFPDNTFVPATYNDGGLATSQTDQAGKTTQLSTTGAGSCSR